MKNKVMNFLTGTALFLAKGKLIMWLYTINMILLSWYATINKVSIDSSVPMMYGAALTAYVGSKGYEFYQEKKQQVITKKQEASDV